MNTQRIVIATLVVGILFFFLGYLIWGLAMAKFFEGHLLAPYDTLPEPEMSLGILFLGQFGWSGLLALVFGRWANISTAKTGAIAGALIFFLMTFGFNFVMYGTMRMTDMTAVIVDIFLSAIMGAIGGAVIALILGYKSK